MDLINFFSVLLKSKWTFFMKIIEMVCILNLYWSSTSWMTSWCSWMMLYAVWYIINETKHLLYEFYLKKKSLDYWIIIFEGFKRTSKHLQKRKEIAFTLFSKIEEIQEFFCDFFVTSFGLRYVKPFVQNDST